MLGEHEVLEGEVALPAAELERLLAAAGQGDAGPRDRALASYLRALDAAGRLDPAGYERLRRWSSPYADQETDAEAPRAGDWEDSEEKEEEGDLGAEDMLLLLDLAVR